MRKGFRIPQRLDEPSAGVAVPVARHLPRHEPRPFMRQVARIGARRLRVAIQCLGERGQPMHALRDGILDEQGDVLPGAGSDC